VARLGYQAQGSFGNFHPYGRIAFAKDYKENAVAVQAGSNTMNGHFTFDGYIPSERWFEADVGLEWNMSETSFLNFAWRAHLNDEGQDMNTLSVGFRKEFGAAAPVVEEPVAEPAPATCADLDDDGDGVSNCEDKCPATPSGEGVGADGCPVPAAEPEMAPKPYRG
jgi:hypothetical protein